MILASRRRGLYPPLSPFVQDRLKVDDTHELYFEQSGNPKGKPVVFLHGGPGGGSSPLQRRFWDPERYRIVLFDQRGAGQSTPRASLHNNTTPHLVDDIEKLRVHLGIERWQVFGGSWGSTLALAYAQKYPEAVSELVLRGIFMLRDREIRWFYQDGASRIFPDAFDHFVEVIPEDRRDDLVGAYYDLLTGDDPEAQLRAAKAWSLWEASTSLLVPNKSLAASMQRDEFALAFARIECHYFIHKGFFDSPTQLFDNVPRIKHIPTVIVQGRYDVVCPMETAWELHRVWPESDFYVAETSGHSAFETEIVHNLIMATDRFAR